MLDIQKLMHFGSNSASVIIEIYAYFVTSYQKWQHLKLFQLLDNKDSQQWAKALYNAIDSEFILATKYFADVLSIISKLTKIFQLDYIALSNVYMQLNAAIESITLEFIGYEDNDIVPTCEYYL
ncbi:2858_t:CDS:2 [Gigaspora margarita]|uniref:2858_t:CDS:1 n=1 Tax=Gigaspora margarita TaxID=4874 RepID=A0ABM8W2G5_GIGMA|nr:2858_t:CDS:2 [Gigaspora margarita]